MSDDRGIDADFGPIHHIGVFQELSDAWLACLRAVVRKGRDARDGGQLIKELLNVTLAVQDCDEETLKSVGADADRIGLMQEKYESLEILPQYRMSYGRLFRDHAGVDQVAWVTRRLRENPESKSATIGFHVPGEDDLSCISLLDWKLRNGLLNVNAVFRSQNVYGSQPGNAVAIARLRRQIAEDLGVKSGFLTLHILSAHIYAEDLHRASRILELPREVVQ